MTWSEASPGVYVRQLGAIEKAQISYILAEKSTHREPIKILCIADFTASHSPSNVEEAFRNAWKALRLLKSPDIATKFDNGNKTYSVPSSQELESWLNETFTMAPSDAAVDSVVRETYTRVQWLPTCHLISKSTSGNSFKGTIVLLISHWRTEAGGSLKLVNQLFDFASDLLRGHTTANKLSTHKPGREVSLLTPSIEEILMPNTQSTPESKARIDAHMENYTNHLPTIDFSVVHSTTNPSSSMKRQQRIYTTASTTSLIQASKAHSISITSIIHAAYISAVYTLAGPEKATRSYASMMPSQTRTRLSPNSPHRDNGCWASTQMLWLTSPPSQPFLTRARGLHTQYRLADDPTWLFEDAREVVSRTLHPSGETETDTDRDTADGDSQPIAMPWFTSIGLLDSPNPNPNLVSDHANGTITINTATVWADNPGPGIVLGQWSFRERLNVQIHWNIAYQDEEVISRTMDLIEAAVEDGVGVRLEGEEVRGRDEIY